MPAVTAAAAAGALRQQHGGKLLHHNIRKRQSDSNNGGYVYETDTDTLTISSSFITPSTSSSSTSSPTMSSSSSSASSSGDSDQISWIAINTYWRLCETVPFSWYPSVTSTGPYNITAVQWPSNSTQSSSQAISFTIASFVTSTNYDWLVQVPGDSTLSVDVVDTGTGQRASGLLGLHISDTLAAGLSSCTVSMSDPIPANAYYAPTSSSNGGNNNNNNAAATSSSSSSSRTGSSSSDERPTLYGGVPGTPIGSTMSVSGAYPNPSDEVIYMGDGSNDGLLKGMKACIALLVVAVAVLAFLNYRARKQVQNLRKGQSTVGRWMNHHHANNNNQTQRSEAEKDERRPLNAPTSSASNKPSPSSGGDKTPRSPSIASRTSFLSRTSGLSSFFATRSASRAGNHGNGHRNVHEEDSAMRSPSSPTSSTSSRGLNSTNPFADHNTHNNNDSAQRHDNGNAGRSHSSRGQKDHSSDSARLSWTESLASDATVTSGSRLSSVTHSDVVSSVGGISAASDEHYHRQKAFTITSSGINTAVGTTSSSGSRSPADSGKTLFLDPSSIMKR